MKLILIITLLTMSAGYRAASEEVPLKNMYKIEVETINGEISTLEEYAGKTLLVVNTASKCGFTGQYKGLQELYTAYKDRGFIVLGFPSNDFLHQEPGTNEEIASFCKTNYGVTFPMFGKISVKGSGQHPLYTYLTLKETNPEFSGKISWNFNKFLIAPDGQIANRFGSRINPLDPKLVAAIEAALEQP
jgi:glutathione peroxidase